MLISPKSRIKAQYLNVLQLYNFGFKNIVNSIHINPFKLANDEASITEEHNIATEYILNISICQQRVI